MLVTYVPLLVLLVVRLALFKRWRVQSWEWLFLSTYVLSGLAYAVFFTRIRFRVPFDLLLICLVAHLIGSVVHEWWGGREVRLGDGEDGVDAMTGGQSRRGSV